MFGCSPQNAGDDSAVARSDFDKADFVIEMLAGAFFQRTPQPVAFGQQRNVVRMFEIRLADDTCMAVSAALIVWRVEAINA